MKGYLLAGCAAIALTGVCGAASAQTAPGKFDIKIGGDAYFTAGAVSQNGEKGTSSLDFTDRFRVQVTATAKADNGLEYGANLRIRAWRGDGVVDTDQAYIFADGTFGRAEGGVDQGPNNQYGVTAPSGFGTGGVVGDWAEGPTTAGGAPHTWLTNQNTFLEPLFGGGYDNITNTNWATRIQYFTPRFFGQGGGDDASPSGLMGMLSFAPSNGSVQTDVNRTSTFASQCIPSAGATLQGCNYRNIVEAGLRYDGTFSGVSVSGSAGYEHGDGVTAPSAYLAKDVKYNDLSAAQVGLQLGYAGVLVGASYLNAGKSGYDTTPGLHLDDQSSITAGISYETGPVVIGFNYAHGEDAGDIAVAGDRNADLYSVGATYTVAPGLTTSLEYLRSETHNEAGYIADPQGDGTANSGNANLFLWKSVVTF